MYKILVFSFLPRKSTFTHPKYFFPSHGWIYERPRLLTSCSTTCLWGWRPHLEGTRSGRKGIPEPVSSLAWRYATYPVEKSEPQKNNEVFKRGGRYLNSVLFNTIQDLTRKFDNQCDRFQALEYQLKENTDVVVKIKEAVNVNMSALKGIIEDVDNLKKHMALLQKENTALRESCLEHAQYKRCWSL